MLAISLVISLSLSDMVHGEMVQPHKLVRSLSILQNRIANGDLKAFSAQKALISEIGRNLLQADTSVWKDSPRNCRAAIKYVLSGGNPNVLKELLREQLIAVNCLGFAIAAVAYGEGRKADAFRYMLEIDPRTLAPSLAGHVALVKALVTEARHHETVLSLLDDARLLSPGTLVEEAALRRAIPLVGSLGRLEDFERLTSRYLRQFPKSIYAEGLMDKIAQNIARHDYGANPERTAKLESIIIYLTPVKRRDFLLRVAEMSIGLGYLKTSMMAINKLVSLVEGEGRNQDRLKVYMGATQILSKEFERGTRMLMSVVPSRLRREDAELVTAALKLAAAVRRLPKPTRSKDIKQKAAPDLAIERNPFKFEDSVLTAKATSAVADVDRLLEEIGP